MKIILGDNQFFGVNHFDLKKGEKSKLKFDTIKKIEVFINDSLEIGLDGFMINSNKKGYEIVNASEFDSAKEIHYSIPYPHKYASMVNETGMMSLFGYVIKNTSFIKNLIGGIKLMAALALFFGLRFKRTVVPAAQIIAVLMLGAITMHFKVADPLLKSLPAIGMLGMCLIIIRLHKRV